MRKNEEIYVSLQRTMMRIREYERLTEHRRNLGDMSITALNDQIIEARRQLRLELVALRAAAQRVEEDDDTPTPQGAQNADVRLPL